jgi:hypothetical protein
MITTMEQNHDDKIKKAISRAFVHIPRSTKEQIKTQAKQA